MTPHQLMRCTLGSLLRSRDASIVWTHILTLLAYGWSKPWPSLASCWWAPLKYDVKSVKNKSGVLLDGLGPEVNSRIDYICCESFWTLTTFFNDFNTWAVKNKYDHSHRANEHPKNGRLKFVKISWGPAGGGGQEVNSRIHIIQILWPTAQGPLIGSPHYLDTFNIILWSCSLGRCLWWSWFWPLVCWSGWEMVKVNKHV